MTKAGVSPLGEMVRRHDPDRFLTSLFAPAERREALWTLYAFNHELARAREVASNPMLALIRLQWWREVVEGADKRHEVATPLRVLLREGVLAQDDLLEMIAGREAEAEESIPTREDFTVYLRRTAGGVAVAAGRMLGGEADVLERLRGIGAAYGAGGVLRGVGALARQGRVLLPEDVLAAHGLSIHDVMAERAPDALRAAQAALAAEARTWLVGNALPRGIRAAGLVGVLARRDLARPGVTRPRLLLDRLAVVAAALHGDV